MVSMPYIDQEKDKVANTNNINETNEPTKNIMQQQQITTNTVKTTGDGSTLADDDIKLTNIQFINNLATNLSNEFDDNNNDNTHQQQSSIGTFEPQELEQLAQLEQQHKQNQFEHEIVKKKEEVDSPIRELIKELYDEAANTNGDNVGCCGSKGFDDSPLEEEEESYSSTNSPVHLVTVKMKPDQDGRFGFNVKGGFDQNCPVLVSRVALNTPADNAYPTKLHEGDQVVSINGVDVSGLIHDEVRMQDGYVWIFILTMYLLGSRLYN